MSAKDHSDMNRLADQIAEGRSLHIAATRLNMSFPRAQWLWFRILAQLGPQADA